MANEPTAARNAYADIAPALGDYTDNVLFGDLWKRPGLSPRDRSLITVATLVALYRTNELPFHLNKALENGVTKDELIELITHLAFYLRSRSPGRSPRSRGLFQSPAPGGWSVWTRTSEQPPSKLLPTTSARSRAPPQRSRCKGLGFPKAV